MIIDTSAIFCILANEAEAPAMLSIIAASPRTVMSAGTLVELAVVIDRKRLPLPEGYLSELLEQLRIAVEPLTASQAWLGMKAHGRFGRTHYPAALNFGDLFSYALAIERNEPLLFKGRDFALTDVRPALPG